ncbi:MAG: hypothetical protein ABIG44_12785 [Planctomycetota bacterium]
MNEETAEDRASCRGPSEGAPSCCGPATSASECGTPSSTGGECCAPATGASKYGKTVVFLLVVGAALAVLAHGLMKSGDEASDQPTMTSAQGQATDAGAVDDIFEVGWSPPDATAAWCGPVVESVPALKKLAAENEVIFVLLPGEDRELAQEISSQIQLAEMTILRQKRSVDSITLPKDADGHAQLQKQFSVASLPCVIALGKGRGAKAVSGEITEKKLLEAFVIASTPASSCSGASGCCPSGGD